MKRKQLGSSTAVHTQQAVKASDDIDLEAIRTINKARHGQCIAATVAYANMQEAVGRLNAHTDSGGKAHEPVRAISNATFEYRTYCIREKPSTVSGWRRIQSRKQRRRRKR